ncbi:MAG: hypothetical protein IJD45_01235 [Clostridia bacterium]|nr:hypothetical protein [Clostridia bacterium]
MNKKTIIIVCVSVVLALIAVSVIATFPTYLFEDTVKTPASSPIASDKVTEPTQGDDVGNLGGNSGTEGVLPNVDNEDVGLSETPTTNYENLAESKGAKLLGETNAFEDGTEFSVDKLGIFDKKYYRSRHKVRTFAKEYLIYNITAQKDGKEVLANGIAKVVINIPENYNLNQIEAYFVSSDDNLIELDCTINKKDKTATVTFIQSGVYMLIERKLTNSSNTSTQAQNSSSNTTSSEKQENSEPDNSGNASSDEPIVSGDSSSNPDTSKNPDVSSKPDTSSDSDTSSEPDTSEPDTSEPDSSEEVDPNKETMNGWTPWH